MNLIIMNLYILFFYFLKLLFHDKLFLGIIPLFNFQIKNNLPFLYQKITLKMTCFKEMLEEDYYK